MTSPAEQLPFELRTLVLSYPPPFVYINDPVTPTMTAKALSDLLSEAELPFARMDSIACFSPRMLFDAILNGLKGCINQQTVEKNVDTKYNSSMDAFLEGLSILHTKSNQRLFVLIENPERLKQEMIVAFARLAELVSL
jgi:origin recognition complex subunit 5